MIRKEIWGHNSCLNSSYENSLFFLALKNPKVAGSSIYQPLQLTNLTTKDKIKFFFEKVFLSIILIIPPANRKIKKAFRIVSTLKSQATLNAAVKAQATPNAAAKAQAALNAAAKAQVAASKAAVYSQNANAAENKAHVAANEIEGIASVARTEALKAQAALNVVARAQAAASNADVYFKKAQASADVANSVISHIDAERAKPEIDCRELVKKYSLILSEPNANGFCEGYVKRSSGKWSHCYISPPGPYQRDENQKVISYVANFPDEYAPSSDNPTKKPVSSSEAITLTSDALKKITPMLMSPPLAIATVGKIESVLNVMRKEAEARHIEVQLEKEVEKKAKEAAELESEIKAKEDYVNNPPEDVLQLRKMQQIFLNENPNPKAWSDTAREVNDYILNKLSLYSQGKPVALPHFFHSTGSPSGLGFRDPSKMDYSSVFKIIKKGQIEQSKAKEGFGVFVSTHDESELFGPHTFAFSEKFIFSVYRATSLNSTSIPKPRQKYSALWVRLEQNIEVSTKTVAHIFAENSAECDKVRAELPKYGLNVPVITRDASRYITKLFEQIEKKYHLPDQWGWRSTDKWDGNLPDNVITNKKKPTEQDWSYLDDHY